jgi:putative phosphoesterase
MLPASYDCELEGVRLHMSHGHELGSPTPLALAARYPVDVVVYGHTHRSLVREIDRTLVVNPGAAGPPRFGLPPSIALLTLPGREVRIVLL